MVVFIISVSPKENIVYIPKILTTNLGYKLSVAPSSKAALIFPEDSNLESVLSSLALIIEETKLDSARSSSSLWEG